MSSNLFFQGMMYLITLIYGGYLIANHEMSPADLAMYALYIGIFISPIQILVEFTEMLQKGLTGFKRFLAVMETEPEIEDAPDAKPLTNVQGHISYEDVSFCYNSSEPVLSHVSFSIPAGRNPFRCLPAVQQKRVPDICPGPHMLYAMRLLSAPYSVSMRP